MNWNKESDAKRTAAILDQYKTYVADIGNIGSRYDGAHKLYFSLLGATIAVLGLTESGKVLQPLSREILWVVAAFGIGLCLLWMNVTDYYSKLFAAKFRVLRELEKSLPAKPYTKETEYLATEISDERPASRRQRIRTLIRLERLIPVFFMVLFVALVAARS